MIEQSLGKGPISTLLMAKYFDIKIYLYEIFYCLTGALAVFSLMEIFKEGMVLAYLNINAVLLAWFFIAIMILVIGKRKI